MVLFAPCKINISLFITGKREDGFHNLKSVFYPIPLYDVLEVIPSNQRSFTTYGTPIQGKEEDNLCLQAIKLIEHDYPLPNFDFHLLKNIPMGAGLGGGSSNAVNTIQLLDKVYGLNIPADKLYKYSLMLGSDCPFFIHNTACLVEGRGEIINKMEGFNLIGKYITLIYPEIHIATREAFSKIIPTQNNLDIIEIITSKPISDWKNYLYNDFESALFPTYPLLSELKELLYQSGAEYAQMSGSGSVLFGLSDNLLSLPEIPYWNRSILLTA